MVASGFQWSRVTSKCSSPSAVPSQTSAEWALFLLGLVYLSFACLPVVSLLLEIIGVSIVVPDVP